MPLVHTIENASQFRDAFHRAGRGEQFSYHALGLLFDYLDTASDENTELDVVEICCDFAESDEDELREAYDIPEGDSVENYITYNSVLVGITKHGSYVYAQF